MSNPTFATRQTDHQEGCQEPRANKFAPTPPWVGSAHPICSKWYQGQVTSSLYRICNLPLMLGAVPCVTAGAYLSSLRHKSPHHVDLLVIDDDCFVGAELADPRPAPKTTPPTALVAALLFIVIRIS